MSFWLNLSLIIGLAIVGYWLFKKINFPAPSIMGPMITIGIYQMMGGGLPMLPLTVISVFQIIIGLSLGARINDRKLADLRKVLRPSAVIAAWTLLSTFGMSFIIHQFTPNMATALFAAAPGGISEMTILALAYDADVPLVSTYQFTRFVVILSVVPIIARWMKQRTKRTEQVAFNGNSVLLNPAQETGEKGNGGTADITDITDTKDTGDIRDSGARPEFKTQLLIYGVGIMGGLILLSLHFPGGGVIGAMAALAVTNVLLKKSYEFPGAVMQVALLGVGISIGLEFSPEVILTMREMLLPIIGFSLIIVLSNFIIGWYLRRLTQWDMVTCLLSTAPGGLSQMLAAAEEMEADPLIVSVLQLVRLLTIIICIPLIAPWFV